MRQELLKVFVISCAFVVLGNHAIEAGMLKVTKRNYNRINIGMTKEQVRKIVGKKPDTIQETTTGSGTVEMWQFTSWTGRKAITVFFHEGRVSGKDWIKL